MKKLALFTVLALLLTGCKGNVTTENKPKPSASVIPIESSSPTDDPLPDWTLDEKIYQMLFVTPESITGVDQVIIAGDTTREALEKYPVGGIIYFASNLIDPEQTREMIQNSQSYSKTPLFIGVDEEGGIVTRISQNESFGVKKIPSMQDIGATGDTDEAYEVALDCGTILNDLGFNVNFAPDADVFDEEASNDIGSRSFASEPDTVGEFVNSYISGLN